MVDRSVVAAQEKMRSLQRTLKEMETVLVAFSGGVDSMFLLHVANQTLGSGCHAITCVSDTMARRERQAAVDLGQTLGLGARHHVINSNELARDLFRQNPTDRCAHCKTELLDVAEPLARKLGTNEILLGTNTDDLGDYRPGIATATSRGAKAPMVTVGLDKSEIRLLSKEVGLPTWDKPQLACLSSRFPYGTEISKERLLQVDLLEEALYDLGFSQLRVRYHGEVARIELLEAELDRAAAPAMRKKIVEAAKRVGFAFAAVDLAGFRSGSLNHALVQLSPPKSQ